MCTFCREANYYRRSLKNVRVRWYRTHIIRVYELNYIYIRRSAGFYYETVIRWWTALRRRRGAITSVVGNFCEKLRERDFQISRRPLFSARAPPPPPGYGYNKSVAFYVVLLALCKKFFDYQISVYIYIVERICVFDGEVFMGEFSR